MFTKFIPLLYVQISPELLTLKNIHSGVILSEPAQIAISTENGRSVVLTGKEVVRTGVPDVAAYIRYYNVDRLHTANGSVSPVQFENSQINVSGYS